jgi:diguanylate cyclase (GGDEF)-like protein/PAS domain S-box-containing protein
MSSAPVAMNLSTPEGRWTRVNPAMCEFLGRSESDLLARDWQSLTHPDDLEADDILHKEVLSGARDAYRLTKRFLRPDGRAVWGDMSVAAVRNDDGQVRYFVGQIVDVTELIHSRDELTASTQRYRMLAEHTSDIVMQLASDGTIEWVSPSVSAVLGWTRDEVVGSPMGGFIAPKAWPLVARALRYASEHGELATGQFQVRRRGGGWLWVDATSTAVLTEGRDVVRVVRLRDVEAEVRSRRALRDSEERFKAAMTATPIGVALIDRDGHVQQTNPALCAMLRGTPASLRGRTITSLTHPEDRSVDLAMWNRLHSGGGDSLTGEKRLLAEDGTVLWVQSALAMVRDEDGVVASYVAQFLDVSEVHEAQAALEAMAHRDPLTELQNRRALLDRISAILSHPPRTGHRLALLYCDIDHFKTLNDSYGHLAGDAVLVAVAHRLSECLREDDAVGRLGGDEFLILLTEVRDEADVLHVADKVRRAVRAPLTVSGVTLHPSISVGAVLAEPGQQPDTVVSRADHALYEAKQQGRDRVALYRA